MADETNIRDFVHERFNRLDAKLDKILAQPIEPGPLRSALGQKTVSDVAQQAGVSEREFLSQLSQNLPEFVDELTPKGKLPSLREIGQEVDDPHRVMRRHPRGCPVQVRYGEGLARQR